MGRVVLAYLEHVKTDPLLAHSVMCLEHANERAAAASRSCGFSLMDRMSSRRHDILSAIAAADVTLIHWWNHPLLYAFLVQETLPPARVIFWSHISGFQAPYVLSGPALAYPDRFVFTSPISLDTPEVAGLAEADSGRLRVIWSTGGVEQYAQVTPKPHAGFNIGYVGTVDYGKMHRSFLRMSSRTAIPDGKFIVCGGPSEKQLRAESLQYGGGSRFEFTGQIDDVRGRLAEFDVFGYPLAPYHYGTCEQSLCESMAAGVPPVVLANRAESYIVEDGVTGIVAGSEEAYSAAIEDLHRDPGRREKLSRNARAAAKARFSVETMTARWGGLLAEVLDEPRRGRHWSGAHSGREVTPSEVFLESLGEHGAAFRRSRVAASEAELRAADDGIAGVYESSHLWRATTRGTPEHYRTFFPEDPYLRRWSELGRNR